MYRGKVVGTTEDIRKLQILRTKFIRDIQGFGTTIITTITSIVIVVNDYRGHRIIEPLPKCVQHTKVGVLSF